MPGARVVKAYNTLTAAFQASVPTLPASDRPALLFAGDDSTAKEVVARLIMDSGFIPVDVGAAVDSWIIEAPRREGAAYGEEYRPEDARRIAAINRSHPDEAACLAAETRRVE